MVRIPFNAITEGGKQYISEEEYKKLSDEEAERYWTIQKNAYIMQGEYVTAEQWQFDTFSFRSGVILKEAIEDLAKLRSMMRVSLRSQSMRITQSEEPTGQSTGE